MGGGEIVTRAMGGGGCKKVCDNETGEYPRCDLETVEFLNIYYLSLLRMSRYSLSLLIMSRYNLSLGMRPIITLHNPAKYLNRLKSTYAFTSCSLRRFLV